jgi:nicotinamidase-related amidase
MFAKIQQQRPLPEKRDLSLAVNRKEDEMLITKHTMSIFIDSDFKRTIRNASITTIVFTGTSTEDGIVSSARHALKRLLSCCSFRCSIFIGKRCTYPLYKTWKNS